MRQIKFRGKRIDNGEWVYGWLVIQPDNTAYISQYFKRGEWIEVDPETVGQFTGLKDKNETPIYEGHILKGKRFVSWASGEQRIIGKVVFRPCCFQLDGVGKYEGINCEEFNPTFEVIGNIYENADLLPQAIGAAESARAGSDLELLERSETT